MFNWLLKLIGKGTAEQAITKAVETASAHSVENIVFHTAEHGIERGAANATTRAAERTAGNTITYNYNTTVNQASSKGLFSWIKRKGIEWGLVGGTAVGVTAVAQHKANEYFNPENPKNPKGKRVEPDIKEVLSGGTEGIGNVLGSDLGKIAAIALGGIGLGALALAGGTAGLIAAGATLAAGAAYFVVNAMPKDAPTTQPAATTAGAAPATAGTTPTPTVQKPVEVVPPVTPKPTNMATATPSRAP